MGNVTNSSRWSARERLLYVEKLAYWRGWVQRRDLCERFGVSVPQASADLAEYQRLYPGHLAYDGSLKRYVATGKMAPRLAAPSFQDGVALLPNTGRCSVAVIDLPSHAIPLRQARSVMRAALSRSPLEIYYFSVNSGTEGWRWILPHAFAHDGYRWHARAWCYENSDYRDFVLGRISRTRTGQPPAATVPEDKEWTAWTTVEFRPNPALSPVQQEAVARDFGMKGGIGRLRVRRAMLHYTMSYLRLGQTEGQKPPLLALG
jgi:predicted DNA-binding transcriptional regulator YafY